MTDVNEFLKVMVINMDFISSEKAKRLNAFAILILIQTIDPKIIIVHFEGLAKHLIYELKNEYNKKFKNINSSQSSIGFKKEVFSQRKAEIRKKHLYEDVDLLSFFKERMEIINSIVNQLSYLNYIWSDNSLKSNLNEVLVQIQNI